jgi:hypothetical protein
MGCHDVCFNFAEANERIEDAHSKLTCVRETTRQAERGTGGMPRCQRPKKDAERGETWTGSCTRAKSRPNPNGATPVRASGRTGA